jgi:hypothetical protein
MPFREGEERVQGIKKSPGGNGCAPQAATTTPNTPASDTHGRPGALGSR